MIVIDLADIVERTGLPNRTCRYAVDGGFLPGLQKAKMPGRGVPRDFLLDEAVAVAVTAALLRAGLSGPNVKRAWRTLEKAMWANTPKPNPLGRGQRKAIFEAAEGNGHVVLEVGDGVNVRLTERTKEPNQDELSTGWIQPETRARVVDDYQPVYTITVDVGQLRDLIRQ